jgi:hypothetical protein
MQYQRTFQGRPWPFSLKSEYIEESQSQYNISSLDDFYKPPGSHESLSTFSPPAVNLGYSDTLQPLSSPQRDPPATPERTYALLSARTNNLTPGPGYAIPVKPQPAHPYRSSHGYGKLTFIHKPDQWGDYNQWTPEECHENRRIICFNKTTYGDVIQLDCFPVPANEYKETMHTISCVRWKPDLQQVEQHKLAGKCIFTSVDIITLLEKLVDYGFTVQEKNRIRRNLEGYRPETVRKEGMTNLFFNQVMAYTAPKVRNIEKDIKVFLWSDLTKALRKVVQKYHVQGGIAIGRPNPQPESSSQLFLNDFSQHSSSESLQTQTTFASGNEYSQPISELQHPFSYSSQDLEYQLQGGSPGVYFQSKGHQDNGHLHQSQISQLQIPKEFKSMDGGETVKHEFTEYGHGIPGK